MKKLILTISLLLPFSAHAAWWVLSWDNPTEREDNTKYDHATEGGNTIIYNAVDASIRASLPPTQLTYEENLPPGCYGVALTAKDKTGRESAWSPLVEWCVLANPKPMTNFKAIRKVQQ